MHLLGCPRKIAKGSWVGYNPNIPHLEVGYMPFTNHLLTSWDIQVYILYPYFPYSMMRNKKRQSLTPQEMDVTSAAIQHENRHRRKRRRFFQWKLWIFSTKSTGSGGFSLVHYHGCGFHTQCISMYSICWICWIRLGIFSGVAAGKYAVHSSASTPFLHPSVPSPQKPHRSRPGVLADKSLKNLYSDNPQAF